MSTTAGRKEAASIEVALLQAGVAMWPPLVRQSTSQRPAHDFDVHEDYGQPLAFFTAVQPKVLLF
jgi:hypothetical protein